MSEFRKVPIFKNGVHTMHLQNFQGGSKSLKVPKKFFALRATKNKKKTLSPGFFAP